MYLNIRRLMFSRVRSFGLCCFRLAHDGGVVEPLLLLLVSLPTGISTEKDDSDFSSEGDVSDEKGATVSVTVGVFEDSGSAAIASTFLRLEGGSESSMVGGVRRILLVMVMKCGEGASGDGENNKC